MEIVLWRLDLDGGEGEVFEPPGEKLQCAEGQTIYVDFNLDFITGIVSRIVRDKMISVWPLQ